MGSEMCIRDRVKKVRSTPPPVRHAALFPPAAPPSSLATVEMVFVKHGGSLPPLTPLYQGPFKVLERGPKFFLLQMDPRQERVSVDRLKPHLGSAPAAPVPVPHAWRLRSAAISYAAAVAGGGGHVAPRKSPRRFHQIREMRPTEKSTSNCQPRAGYINQCGYLCYPIVFLSPRIHIR